MAEAARLICDARASIGEGPVLDGETLRWSDPVARRLLSLDRDGGWHAHPVDAAIWSLAVLPDGRMIGTLDERFATVDMDGGIRPGPAAELSAGTRFNDMIADPTGVLWVGAMHRGVLATRGAIYRAEAIDDRPCRVADGLGVPNGMALAPDGRTLFVIDTLARTLLAYSVIAPGLAEPAIVSDFLDLPGKPDGMAIDDRGRFHVAMWGGGCIAHIAADGATLGTTAVPAPHVSSACMAPDGRLIVTTSRMRLSPAALEQWPQSGGVFEIMPEMLP